MPWNEKKLNHKKYKLLFKVLSNFWAIFEKLSYSANWFLDIADSLIYSILECAFQSWFQLQIPAIYRKFQYISKWNFNRNPKNVLFSYPRVAERKQLILYWNVCRILTSIKRIVFQEKDIIFKSQLAVLKMTEEKNLNLFHPMNLISVSLFEDLV